MIKVFFISLLLLLSHFSYSYADLSSENEEAFPLIDYPVTLYGAYLAARHAGAQKDIATAADYYRQALDLHPENNELLNNTFLLELADGRIEDALTLAETLTQSGQNGIARLALGVRALKARQYRLAQRHLEDFTGEPFGQLVQSVLTAWALQGQGNTDAALTVLDALQGVENVDIFKTYHRGLILSLSRQNDQALQDLQNAWLADSNTLRMTQSFASALVRDGQKDEAIGVLEGFLASNAQHPYIANDLEKINNDILIDAPVGSVQEGAAEVLYGLGSSINRGGGEEIAAIYLQLALYLDPKAELGRVALAGVFENLSLYDHALETHREINEGSPLKAASLIREGVLLEQLKRSKEADTHMRALLESNPDDLNLISVYGNILRFREDYKGAEKIYTKAINTLEDIEDIHWIFFYHRGITFERTERWPLAEKDFLKALDLFPEQPDVLNYLGYTWVDKGMHIERAVDMIEKAVELRPNAGHIVDSLGWAYYRLGRYEEAVDALEKAVALLPSEAVILDHLGDAYWQAGRRLEARFQWSHAKELAGEDKKLLQKVNEKLSNGLTLKEDDAAHATKDATISE